jgi:hypothetical protein
LHILELRSEPIEDLSLEDAREVIRELDFFDIDTNWEGKGLIHQYEEVERNSQKLIIDHTTELIWQLSGSPDHMSLDQAQDYVTQLKRDKFAGNSDWRLPTLEEAMSLMEPVKNDRGLFINKVFHNEQEWI